MQLGSGRELPVPPGGKSSASVELARVWDVGDDSIQFAIAIGRHTDPIAWGVIVADLVRHVAKAYGQANKTIPEEYILDRIVTAVRNEFDPEFHAT